MALCYQFTVSTPIQVTALAQYQYPPRPLTESHRIVIVDALNPSLPLVSGTVSPGDAILHCSINMEFVHANIAPVVLIPGVLYQMNSSGASDDWFLQSMVFTTGPEISIDESTPSPSLRGNFLYTLAPVAGRPWIPQDILLAEGTGTGPSLLWRNIQSGEASLWVMNGPIATASGTIYNGGTEWAVEHAADFDGDGEDDLLWRNTVTGAHAIWLMNGTSVSGGGSVYTPDTGWRILACGDYNGDGKSDLLWRNTADGEVVIFAMNGTSVISATSILPRNLGWSPLPVVLDLDGDGTSDILWTLDTGLKLAAWIMGPGLTVEGGVTLYSGSDYALLINALGDFNNDGTTDLVWRNATTSDTSVWLMNGLGLASAASIYFGDSAWVPAGAADFDGDGKDDLLWHNSSIGDYAGYRMDCSASVVSVAGGAIVYHGSTDWNIMHIADFDGDGKNDLLWRSTGTGSVVLWLMDGFSIKPGGATTLY